MSTATAVTGTVIDLTAPTRVIDLTVAGPRPTTSTPEVAEMTLPRLDLSALAGRARAGWRGGRTADLAVGLAAVVGLRVLRSAA